MTTLNTIIEEEKREFDVLYGWVKPLTLRLGMWSFTTTAMQRAYEVGANNERASWLRSEIEKLEKFADENDDGMWAGRELCDSIITRYKEELKELESK